MRQATITSVNENRTYSEVMARLQAAQDISEDRARFGLSIAARRVQLMSIK